MQLSHCTKPYTVDMNLMIGAGFECDAGRSDWAGAAAILCFAVNHNPGCIPEALEATTRIIPAQALDSDQDGTVVLHRKLFEEDREYNQGACSLVMQHSGDVTL